MSIEEQLKDIVANIVHVDKSLIRREGTFKEINADSLDIVQILLNAEETYDIEIPDEDAEQFQNFGDFVDYVERCVTAKKK
ncbi:Acyl carrier protein [subsurface metagenome]